MEITEVRIKLMENSQERLQAFCSVTFDSCFVVRDLKIIQGTKGSFVAMPSRKLTDRCPRCHTKNHLRAHYCNQCGAKLDEERAVKDYDGRAKLYADIAHPIKSDCRDGIQQAVLLAYEEELVKARQPNYRCTYDDYGEDDFEPYDYTEPAATTRPVAEVVHNGSQSRRFEPGTNGQSQPPEPHHIRKPEQQPQKTPAWADHPESSDDEFGKGIL